MEAKNMSKCLMNILMQFIEYMIRRLTTENRTCISSILVQEYFVALGGFQYAIIFQPWGKGR